MRQSVIIGFFGRRRDRFSEQGEALTLSAKFDLAARVLHIQGVEVIFPDEVAEAQTIVAESTRTGLQIAAINVNLKDTGLLSSAMNMSGNIGSFVSALVFPLLVSSSFGASSYFYIAAVLSVAAAFCWWRLRWTES